MKEADSYVVKIRHKAKREYAQKYLAYLRGEAPQPTCPKELTYMGAQAVRLNLDSLVAKTNESIP